MPELRDSAAILEFLAVGWWWRRVLPRTTDAEVLGLIWPVAQLLAEAGTPLPPLGFLADFLCWLEQTRRSEPPLLGAITAPRPLPAVLQRYEEQLVGRWNSDLPGQRVSPAWNRLLPAERPPSAAFLISSWIQQADLGGWIVHPRGLRQVLRLPADEFVQQAWFAASADSARASAQAQADWYERLLQSSSAGTVGWKEIDLIQLETHAAAAPAAARLGLRQILQAAEELGPGEALTIARLPHAGSFATSQSVVEDQYPMGGYESLSPRGPFENLLPSQLAYIEPDPEHRPDLFDVKYLRQELLYFSRDEHQAVRSRWRCVWVIADDLFATHVKDAGSSWQRWVWLWAAIVWQLRWLEHWLEKAALHFELVLISDAAHAVPPEDRAILELLFRPWLSAGQLHWHDLDGSQCQSQIEDWRRQAACRVVVVQSQPSQPPVSALAGPRLSVESATPVVISDPLTTAPETSDAGSLLHSADSWKLACQTLLREWFR